MKEDVQVLIGVNSHIIHISLNAGPARIEENQEHQNKNYLRMISKGKYSLIFRWLKNNKLKFEKRLK
jgi:hypothetical protein